MRIRVFISSVQKELADERLALQILISTDPFLSQHCVPILYEEYPAPLRPDPQAYLEVLGSCHVYVGVLWKEYGRTVNDLSATHHEYRFAQNNNFPTLVTIKGSDTTSREDALNEFIQEVKSDGHTYSRFNSTEELQRLVRARLIQHIQDTYDLTPTEDQERSAEQTIRAASLFERQRLDLIAWEDVLFENAAQFVAKAEDRPIDELTQEEVKQILWQRGYLWRDDEGAFQCTAAGILLFTSDPSRIFPHCRIQISAFPGNQRSANPLDHLDIREPLPQSIDSTVAFIKKNTRHPLRVVGLNRINVDEYPEEAVREALVNALAHRDYEDTSRRITVDLFKDRIEITSPGGLAGNLTLNRLRSGHAKSRSRNPNLAQGLVMLDRMEERGTGIQRMTDAMLDHGLDSPEFNIIDDEVVVKLPGPGENLDRIRTPADIASGLEPSVENKLTDRQKEILSEAVLHGSVTSGWVTKTYGITRETAVQDLGKLKELKLLRREGKGPSTRYEPNI